MKMELQDMEDAVLRHGYPQKSAKMKLITFCVTQYSIATPFGQFLPF